MKPMSTMYTQNAIVVASTKALYTCATLYPETTMSTKKNNVSNGDSVHKEYNDHNDCIDCTVHKAYRIYNVYNDYKDYTENN